MQSSLVQIHTGGVDGPYKVVGNVEAKKSKATAFSAEPTLDEVNSELRRQAADMFCNAIINVEYKRSITLFSYGVLKAWGTAVILESDEVGCPACAERIKRAAIKCKHCGTAIAAT